MKAMSIVKSLLAISLIGSIIGCGSSNNGSDSNAKSGGKAAADETVELDFWAWAPNEDEWKQAEEKFAAQYPNIKINFTRFSSQDYAEKIRVAIAGNSAPDLMGFELSMAGKYASALEPLAPYAEKAWGANWKDRFKAEPLKQVEDIDYKLLPTGVAVTPVIVYNADMFEKAGAQPPETMEQLKEVLKKFEAAKLDGVIPRLGFPGGKNTSFNDFYFNVVNQMAPGKLYEANDGKIPFTDPDIVKATEMFKSFYTDGIVQDGNLTVAFSPQLTDLFFTGKKFPMIVAGAWTLNWIKQFQDDGGNYGIIPVPSVEGGKHTVLVNADLPLGINKNSKHKDAAWKFIEFMAAGEYQQIENKSLLFLPIVKGIDADHSLLASEISKQGAQTVVDLAENNAGGARFISNPEISEAIYMNMQKVVTNALTPQAAMEEVQKVSESVKR